MSFVDELCGLRNEEVREAYLRGTSLREEQLPFCSEDQLRYILTQRPLEEGFAKAANRHLKSRKGAKK